MIAQTFPVLYWWVLD